MGLCDNYGLACPCILISIRYLTNYPKTLLFYNNHSLGSKVRGLTIGLVSLLLLDSPDLSVYLRTPILPHSNNQKNNNHKASTDLKEMNSASS